ncbi:type I secretion system permease/ATPase [Arenibaculum sp.]|uniref:type I secretion system permease/ATPase n=1 Tax=Arenibaculum sp. TaxID=2865862 RepID=UPI002E1654DB|nr:type I secretion system permease/ATPase [Arenibaculum sp.]
MSDLRETSFAQALARARGSFVAAGGFSLAVNLLMLTSALYMMQVFDRVLSSGRVETLVYLTLLAAGALLLLAVLDVVRGRVLVRVAAWTERVVAPGALARSVDAALRRGDERADALRDLAVLRGFLGGPGMLALFDLPWVPVYLAVAYLLHPVLGHVALAGAAVLFALAVANDRLTHVPLRQAEAAARRALRTAEAGYRNAEVVDALGLVPGLARRWGRDHAQAVMLQTRAADRAGLVLGMAKFSRLFVQVAILGVGAWLVLGQELTAGAMVAGSILLGRALAPAEQAISIWRQAVAAREAKRRLRAFFDRPERRPAGMALPTPEGRFAVEDITFTFAPGGRPVLDGVSFSLAPGETLGIVGPSAAGKSTLARLLVGVEAPARGAVRLDGADLFAWPRADLARHLGYLPQDVELFAGTVAENVARLGPVDPEAVVAAARLANCHEMVLRLENGYATELGENGAKLSGGQRQRIALARALYGAPRLVVLDEPNASLDGEGEVALNRAIRTLRERGTTVVVIGHRPSTLAAVDKVLVLAEGRVERFGPRQEVLEALTRRSLRPVPARPAGEGAR